MGRRNLISDLIYTIRKKKHTDMKYLKRFNESLDPFDPKQRDMLDVVRSGDIDELERYLSENRDKMARLVTQAIKFSAPGTKYANPAIFGHVMDKYIDQVDKAAVDSWLYYDKAPAINWDAVSKNRGRDIDEHGNDWYYFDHPDEMPD